MVANAPCAAWQCSDVPSRSDFPPPPTKARSSSTRTARLPISGPLEIPRRFCNHRAGEGLASGSNAPHMCKAVRWLSGRRRRTRNAVYLKGYRGFKSHPHRFAYVDFLHGPPLGRGHAVGGEPPHRFESCTLRSPHVDVATLAQLVEQCFRKAKVPGSNPGGGSE